nr:mitochondrial glycoprotein [Tanacetum cinerariifolium]
MALRLIGRLGKKQSSSIFYSRPITTLIQKNYPRQQQQLRGYVSEMRKTAFEDRICRLIRNDVQYELDRSPPTQLVPKFKSFAIDERSGEQWIRLNKKFGDNEEIKVEVTMFQVSTPPAKESDVTTSNDLELYISMVIDIFKDEENGILEFVCNVWPDSVEIEKVFMRDQDGMTGKPYMGPPFDDLDDELQTSLYDFLEERGINDELAVFLHKSVRDHGLWSSRSLPLCVDYDPCVAAGFMLLAARKIPRKTSGHTNAPTYSESSHRNSQTQFLKSESCDRKKRPKKRRKSPVTASRGTHPSQTASVFSRLRHERDKPTCRRSLMSATVFTRLGPGDKNVFTRLGKRKRGVHSRLGPEDAPRYRRVSRKRSTSKSAETPSQRRNDAREIIRSYVTCSSKRQQEIKEEWNSADRTSRRSYTGTEELYYSENDHDQGGHWKSKKHRSNDEDDLSQPWLCEITDPFTTRI